MLKHSIVLGAFVAVLVGLMLYFMSPGEVTTAYAGAKSKVSDAAGDLLAALHWRASAKKPLKRPASRNLLPDPFYPYSPRPVNSSGSVRTWFGRPEMLWFLAAVVEVLWLQRRARRKRFQFAVEQKMASTLSKAVRQMGGL